MKLIWPFNGAKNIYIHIPFCLRKCKYCCFFSIPYKESIADSWLKTIKREISSAKDSITHKIETIYIGGGTPNSLKPNQLADLLKFIRKTFISDNSLKEWSIEINPGIFNQNIINIIKEFGINRISIGTQIFDDYFLSVLGRPHSVKDIINTVELLNEADLTNYNLDLIAGIPELSLKNWQKNVKRAIELKPRHISIYMLSLEPETELYKTYQQKIYTDKFEKTQIIHMEEASSILQENGYIRYEISNFCQRGYECQHNLNFWNGEDYLGFGPSACSRVSIYRFKRIADIEKYIKLSKDEFKHNCFEYIETLSNEKDIRERIAFAFRLTAGFNLEEKLSILNSSEELKKQIKESIANLASEGLVKLNSNYVQPTKSGLKFVDYIARVLI